MFSERSRKTFNLTIVTTLLLLAHTTQLAHAAYTIEQLLNKPYFDASDIKTVRKGGFGVAKIHEVSDREIAVVIACLVKGKPEDALAPFLGDSLPVDEELLEDQRLIDTESQRNRSLQSHWEATNAMRFNTTWTQNPVLD